LRVGSWELGVERWALGVGRWNMLAAQSAPYSCPVVRTVPWYSPRRLHIRARLKMATGDVCGSWCEGRRMPDDGAITREDKPIVWQRSQCIGPPLQGWEFFSGLSQGFTLGCHRAAPSGLNIVVRCPWSVVSCQWSVVRAAPSGLNTGLLSRVCVHLSSAD
jgi:hypothetical protein